MTTSVLFVCTANRCRSPVAAALLQLEVAARDLDVMQMSAGLLESGQPPVPEAVRFVREVGLDLRQVRSQTIEPDLLRSAGLVIGMERRHVREIVLEAPEVWPRTFTLKELVRRGALAGPRRPPESVEGWLARVHAGRTHRELLGSSSVDDVEDPVGGPPDGYRIAFAEISDLVRVTVDMLYGRFAAS